MKIDTPQIAWHDRGPVYSVDIQPVNQVDASTGQIWYRLATSGADSQIIIWKVLQRKVGESTVRFEVLSQLVRHERAVNVVRFIPTGDDTLASADVDGLIYIWKKGDVDRFAADFDQQDKSTKSPPKKADIMEVTEEDDEVALEGGSFEDEIIKIENWNQFKVLRGHLEDVVDVSWSSDGNYLISGSVDNESIVWDVNKGCKIHMLSGHKSWVQGVAYDPLNDFLATMSADRSLRIFSVSSKKTMFRIDRGKLMHEGQLIKSRLFYDYTLQSFTRRLSFSPNGEFLLVPSGVLEFPKSTDSPTVTPSKKIPNSSQESKPSDCSQEDKKSSPEKNKSQVTVKDCSSKTDKMNVDGDVVKSPDLEVPRKDTDLNNVVNPATEATKNGSNVPETEIQEEAMETEEADDKEYEAGDEEASGEDDEEEEDEVLVTRVKLPPPPPEEPELNYINCCHLFLRSNISKPLAYIPVGDKFCHAVRFCPTRFQLISEETASGSHGVTEDDDVVAEEPEEHNAFPFPYRLVFAIATQNSVILYDSQHMSPFGFITDIHYARISDIAWSKDGMLLMISSTDGYCTFVTFGDGELGLPYEGEPFVFPVAPSSPEKVAQIEPEVSGDTSPSTKGSSNGHSSAPAVTATPEVVIKTPSVGKFFSKLSKEERLEVVQKELQSLDTTPKRPKKIDAIPEVVLLQDSQSPAKHLDSIIEAVASGIEAAPVVTEKLVAQSSQNGVKDSPAITTCVTAVGSPKNPFVLSIRKAPKTGVEALTKPPKKLQHDVEKETLEKTTNGSCDAAERPTTPKEEVVIELTDSPVKSSGDSKVDDKPDEQVNKTTTTTTEVKSDSMSETNTEEKKPRRVNFVTLIKANKKPAS